MLQGAKILAWGRRDAVRFCASLLEQAGAIVEYARERPLEALKSYDAVIVSSDRTSYAVRNELAVLEQSGSTLLCDVTAIGGRRSGPDEDTLTDGEIQALSGLMDTTGFVEGEPVLIGLPFTEISAGMYAASAIAAALFAQRSERLAQRIDVSLYACAVNALTTFLPKGFSRTRADRVGNRHTSAAPWNGYRTRDGWILICTSTDEQWRRMKALIGHEDLDFKRFESLANRLVNVNELDTLVETWTLQRSTAECLTACLATGIAAGPIVSLASLHEEPNFRLRHPKAARDIANSGLSTERFRDISAFSIRSGPPAAGQAQSVIPKREAGSGPLSGIKVVEIGQYTTAPLAGKHLAALGAEVVKIESPYGEISRKWLPGQDGISYFFALNNTDKSTVFLDLNNDEHRSYLNSLLMEADVLLENLRPGALSKFGFSRSALAQINPSLIYCSISGFGTGTNSAYPERPAFDAVIQAMGGIMDLTRDQNGTPVKTGASVADILGGQAALFAIIAALCASRRNSGTFVEISMQDVAAWAAIFRAGNDRPTGLTVACADGYVYIDEYTQDVINQQILDLYGALSRTEVVSALSVLDLHAVPIMKVHELMDDADFLTEALGTARDDNSVFWPIVKLPYRLSRTPVAIRRILGNPERPKCSETFPDKKSASKSGEPKPDSIPCGRLCIP